MEFFGILEFFGMIVESRLFFSTLGLNRRAKITTSSRGENLTLERARAYDIVSGVFGAYSDLIAKCSEVDSNLESCLQYRLGLWAETP